MDVPSARDSTLESRRLSRGTLWPGVGWAVLLLCAAWIVATGPAVLIHNADSLIPIFVSLDQWSIFYWGQDRFGMLLPLMALPVRDSFANLLAQNILSLILFLAGMTAALGRCRVKAPALFALLSVNVLLSFKSHQILLLLFTTNQSYAPALGCFGIAAYCCRGRAWFPGWLALTFMLLGAWTNGGVALFLTTFSLLLVAIPTTRAYGRPLLVGGIASLMGHRLLQIFASANLLGATSVARPGSADLMPLLSAFWGETFQMYGPVFWPVVGVLWALALAAVVRRPDRRRELAGLFALGAAVVLYGAVMALFLRGGGRHIMAALPLLPVAPFLILARTVAVPHWLTNHRPIAAFAAIWLIALNGFHHPGKVRRAVIACLGQSSASNFYSRQVTAITGDYWSVWPVTFATNLIHEANSGQRPVLPLTIRSEPLHTQIGQFLHPGALVAVLPADRLDYWQAHPSLPPLDIDDAANVIVVPRVHFHEVFAAAGFTESACISGASDATQTYRARFARIDGKTRS